MKLLLDTHTFYWWAFEPERLSARVLSECADPENEVILSVASVWEMQNKSQLGKLFLERPLDVVVAQQVERNGLQVLPVSLEHVFALASLPLHQPGPL